MPNASSLHNAARNGSLAELGKCLSEDVDVNATDKHQRTALHLAAWAGHADVAKALLSAPGIQKKACAMDQMTALHFGAMNGHTEVCRLLLNAGIPVNGKTRKAVTPLHFACQKGHEETVQLLLNRKAGPYMKDSKGENALDKCKDSEACRAAVQAAMDSAAAHTPEFSKKKRGRNEGGGACTDGDAAIDAHASAGKDKAAQDSSGDDDEEDIIPLKRTLVAPKPHPQPLSTPSESVTAVQGTGGDTGAPCEVEESESEGILQESGVAPVRPPVAAAMRPPVARGGPSRGLQAGGALGGP